MRSPAHTRRGPDGRFLPRDAVIRWDGEVRVLRPWDADDDPEGDRRLTWPVILLCAVLGLMAYAACFWVGFAVWRAIP